ncbi:MAG TPA: zinc ABC transporter ATP-binding protein AztA [Aliidongia sp.]|nr:zinc ABC transporter ATP-binding protein AztA [Aliidongia sp.]
MSKRQARGAAVTVENLTVAYERHPAIHHIGGRFAAGSLTAIVGPNGAGKSTLVKTIAGTLRPASGHIRRDPAGPASLAYLPQQSEIERGFPITVLDTVMLGAWRRIGWHRSAGRAELDAALAALDAVGLAHFEQRGVSTLSAGQFQRVLFARLMVQDAPLILLDEPFNALDAKTTRDLLALVERWHGEGRTIIAVLHDYEQVRAHFPDSLLLARELVAWGPTADVLTADNLLAARRISEAWDENAQACHEAAADAVRLSA